MAVLKEVVPDIGDFKNVEIIEVLVKPGDVVNAEDSLITLESDKAAMEVPSPFAGVVKAMQVNVGDRVSSGSPILQLEVQDQAEAKPAEKAAPVAEAEAGKIVAEEAEAKPAAEPVKPAQRAPVKARASPVAERALKAAEEDLAHPPHASPSVRKFARELGAELRKFKVRGPKADLERGRSGVRKGELEAGEQALTGGVFAMPPSRRSISRSSGYRPPAVVTHQETFRSEPASSWVSIPTSRSTTKPISRISKRFASRSRARRKKQNVKLTFLPFVMKAVVAALKAFPTFNFPSQVTAKN